MRSGPIMIFNRPVLQHTMQYLSPKELGQFRAYREAHPHALAFQHAIAPHNPVASGLHELSGYFNCSSSIKEMALEFQLEQFHSQSLSLTSNRSYVSSSDFLPPSGSSGLPGGASGAAKATLSLPSNVGVENLPKVREKRNEIVNAHSSPPNLNPCIIQADILRSEVTLAADLKLDIFGAHNLLLQFYKQRKSALVQKKFKNLLRYTRFCTKNEIVEKISPIFQQRLTMIEAEYGSVCARCLRLEAPLKGQLSQPEEQKSNITAHIDPTDFVVYLRWLACQQATTKNVHRFVKRIQWSQYTSRLSIHRRSIDIMDSETSNPHEFSGKAPWVATTAEEISELLDLSEEVSARVHRKEEPKRPQQSARPFRSTLSREQAKQSHPTSARSYRPAHDTYNSFLATFKKQASMMHFPAYETAPPFVDWNTDLNNTGSEQDFVKKVKESSNRTNLTYLKHSTWLSDAKTKPKIDSLQMAQSFKLSQIKTIDEILKACAAFLDYHDETYVTAKLVEMAQLSLAQKHSSTNTSNIPAVATSITNNNNNSSNNNNINSGNTSQDNPSQSAANFFHPPLKMDIPLDSPMLSTYYHRHLQLRTIKRGMLRQLNYFRSIHKKITFDINTFCSGPQSAHEGRTNLRPQSWDSDLETVSEMNIPLRKTANPTPSDVWMSDEDLMNSKQLDNRDDRYSIDADGEYSIKDAKGVFVMYDISLQDFSELEDEILRIGTHFLRKSALQTNVELDRMTILQELYENELKYLENKRKIVDCYVEMYEHLIDPPELSHTSQLIFDWIAVRPHIHWEANGISEIYSTNIEYLSCYYNLLRHVINSQLDDQRLVKHIHQSKSPTFEYFGFPDPPTVNQVVYLFPQSVPIGVFDFCESLSSVIKLDSVIKSVVVEFVTLFRPSTPLEICAIQRAVLEHCLSEWIGLTEMKGQGTPYEGLIPVMEDPIFIDAAIKTSWNSLANSAKIERVASTYVDAMQFLITRKELLDACYETDILLDQYKAQAEKVGLTNVLLDVPLFPSIFLSKEVELSPQQNRGIPAQTPFAISLFDPSLSEFDFHTMDGIQEIISPESIVRLHKALQVQLMYKNLLIICVQYNQIRLDPKVLSEAQHSFYSPQSVLTDYCLTEERADSKSTILSDGEAIPYFLSLSDKCARLTGTLSASYSEQYKHILKTSKPELFQSAVFDLKLQVIDNFCSEIMTEMYAYSLRHQMVWIVSSTLNSLKSMKIGEETFLFGELQSQQSHMETSSIVSDEDFGPLKKAPQLIVYDSGCPQIMSREGKTTNIFYLPHCSEILRMFEDESLIIQIRGLSACLRIFYALHDIIVLLHLQTRLSHGDLELAAPSAKTAAVELQKLKNDILHLPDPTNSEMVIEFLWEKRRALFFRLVLALENFADNLMLNDRLSMYQFVRAQIQTFTNYSLPCKFTSTLFPSMPPTIPSHLNSGNQEFYDSFFQNHHNLTGFTRFRFFYENIGIPFVGWLPRESYAPEKLMSLLLALGDSDRKFIEGEFQALDLQLEEHQVERGVYGLQLEDSLKVQVSYLATSLAVIASRRYFLSKVTGIYHIETKSDVTTMDHAYKELILTRAWNFFRDKQQDEKAGKSKPLQAKLVSEYALRSILLRIIKKETSCLLLRETISEAQENLSILLQEKADTFKSEEDRLLAMDKDVLAKVTFMEEFLEDLARKATLRPVTNSDEQICSISLTDLNRCLDSLALRLKDWGAQILDSRTFSLHALHAHLTNLLFLREQTVRHLEHQTTVDARNVHTQIELEVSNRGLDLVFEVNSLHRQMLEMKEKAEAREKATRRAVKEEYDSIVNLLQGKLISTASQFETYKAQLHRDLLEVVASLKTEALRRFVDYDTITAKVAGDESMTSGAKMQDLLMENLEFKKTIMKYQTTAKMKEIGIRAVYESKIRKIDEEKHHAEKHLATLKQDIEMREAVLRQQLAFTQSQLGKSQMLLREALKEKEKSEKRNDNLSKWKNAKSQVLMELAEKVKQHEKFANVDVEQILLEVDNLKTKLAAKTEAHEDATKSILFIESRYQKEINRLQRELANERRMKQMAVGKLKTAREQLNEQTDLDEYNIPDPPSPPTRRPPRTLVPTSTIIVSSSVQPTPPPSRPKSAPHSRGRSFASPRQLTDIDKQGSQSARTYNQILIDKRRQSNLSHSQKEL